MPIVTFWNGTKEHCGTTSSSVAFATQLAMEHNMKILLITTSFNDTLIKDCFWKETKSSLFFKKTSQGVETAGIEGFGLVKNYSYIAKPLMGKNIIMQKILVLKHIQKLVYQMS